MNKNKELGDGMKKRWNPNNNHPIKGRSVLVEPIRSTVHLQAIIELLKDKPRDRLLFIMGVNNGVRTGDLLKLRVVDVMHLREGQFVGIKENKTKKKNFIFVNAVVFEALSAYLKDERPRSTDWLFPSQQGNKPITVQYVNNLIKRWGRAVGVVDNLGAHSLRKTWGYHQRFTFHTPIEVITQRFRHTSPTTTMAYLGITPEEVLHCMSNNIGQSQEVTL